MLLLLTTKLPANNIVYVQTVYIRTWLLMIKIEGKHDMVCVCFMTFFHGTLNLKNLTIASNQKSLPTHHPPTKKMQPFLRKFHEHFINKNICLLLGEITDNRYVCFADAWDDNDELFLLFPETPNFLKNIFHTS